MTRAPKTAAATHEAVSTTRHASVALVTIDAPPVNALSRPVRMALWDALQATEDDPEVTAVVIAGTRNFSAGAHLQEFDNGEGLAEPSLHATIAGFLDRTRLTSVAAISGVALGGGLELALACSMRVAAPDAKLGLPETTLGFLPGAGGTQRLPRAVGVERGVDLIVTGRRIDGETALADGLVDAVSDDPVDRALALAAAADGVRTRLRDRPIDEHMAPAFIEVAMRDARRARRPAGVLAALEAIEIGCREGFDRGLEAEFTRFQRIAETPQAKATRYRFLSDRAAGRGFGRGSTPPERAAVVGGGTMGRGIALALLSAGLSVTLVETDEQRSAAAAEGIHDALTRGQRRGRLTEADVAEREARLRCQVGLGDLGDRQLVVEAVFEDFDLKRSVLRELDRAAPGAILASNTSSLDLEALSGATERPEDVVGMHFFSPADVMPLVEVVRTARTSQAALDVAVGVSAAMGKTAVVVTAAPGFVGNRIFDQYLRQAGLLLREGVLPWTIDDALEAWGMAMGPFKVLDLIGNDVTAAGRRERGDADPAWEIADEVTARGWFGRKSGIGWYSYADGIVPNAQVAELMPSATDGAYPADAIADRCVLALINEATAVLAEGVASNPQDVDTVIVKGYGFPAQRGGPVFFARQIGLGTVRRRLAALQARTADPFWKPHPRLEELLSGDPS